MKRILKNFYKMLIEKGWTLNQIDESDIFFLFELFSKEDEEVKTTDTVVYAEQVPWL